MIRLPLRSGAYMIAPPHAGGARNENRSARHRYRGENAPRYVSSSSGTPVTPEPGTSLPRSGASRRRDREREQLGDWQGRNLGIEILTFAESAGRGEIVVKATSGSRTLDALALAKAANLRGKVLIDVANPLDFSNGMPPTLFVKDTDCPGRAGSARLPRGQSRQDAQHGERRGHGGPRFPGGR